MTGPAVCAGPATRSVDSAAPWTSTPSSPRTPPSGGAWTSWPAAAASTAPRPTSWSRCTGRWPPTCRWCSPARPTRRSPPGCRALLARGPGRRGRHAAGAAAGRRWPAACSSTSRSPSTAPGAGRSAMARGQPRRLGGDDAVAARAPRAHPPGAARRRGAPARRPRLRDYYSAHPAQSFAAQVWTNNALVAALALFLGVTLVGTLYVLWQNTRQRRAGRRRSCSAPARAAVFFGLILPHGHARADRGLRRRRRSGCAPAGPGSRRAALPRVAGAGRSRAGRPAWSRSGSSACCSCPA